ncbi:MAG: transcription elongation factor GreA [Candidatus Omnitrophota bacterium]
MDEVFLTQKGYEQLKGELDELKTTKRRQIAQQLAKARAMGDLSENAEYDAAKEAQAHLEKKIAVLEGKLSRARIIENENISSDKVYIGARVSLSDQDSGEECVYILVSPTEADYTQSKLSLESPIGKALLGRKVGDVVEVAVPAGVLKYKITAITR